MVDTQQHYIGEEHNFGFYKYETLDDSNLAPYDSHLQAPCILQDMGLGLGNRLKIRRELRQDWTMFD